MFWFIFGIDLGCILNRIRIVFLSFWASTNRQNVFKIDANIGIERRRFRGGPAPRCNPRLEGGKEGKSSLGDRRFGRKEEKKKGRKLGGKEGR